MVAIHPAAVPKLRMPRERGVRREFVRDRLAHVAPEVAQHLGMREAVAQDLPALTRKALVRGLLGLMQQPREDLVERARRKRLDLFVRLVAEIRLANGSSATKRLAVRLIDALPRWVQA